jgi:hypothetical protein
LLTQKYNAFELNDRLRHKPVGNPRLQPVQLLVSWLSTLMVALDNIFNGIGAPTAVAFDVLPRARQKIDALANSAEVFVVDVPVLECQRFGQGADQFDFVSFH